MDHIEENRIETNPLAAKTARALGETNSDISGSPSDIEIAFRELEAPWRENNEAHGALMSADATFQELRPWLPRELYMREGELFFKSTDSGDPIVNDDVIEPLRARLRLSGQRKRLREIVDAYDAWKTKIERISEFAGLRAAEAICDERSNQFHREVDRICEMRPTSVRDSVIHVYCYALVRFEDRKGLQIIERLAEQAGVETNISLPWENCDPEPSADGDPERSAEQ